MPAVKIIGGIFTTPRRHFTAVWPKAVPTATSLAKVQTPLPASVKLWPIGKRRLGVPTVNEGPHDDPPNPVNSFPVHYDFAGVVGLATETCFGGFEMMVDWRRQTHLKSNLQDSLDFCRDVLTAEV
jgi:hypothetical protein